MTATTTQSTPAADQRVTQRGRSTVSQLVRGKLGQPTWERPSLIVLLVAAGCLYTIGLAGSHWANGYYSAAVFAGSKSWTAMLFGSLDPANFISVDKPPAALWFPDILARLFGLNAWTVLLPQALEGVAAVGLLHATVRRQSGALAGLLAGASMAITPVCALMFRFNNPDALLTLLYVASAYATMRAVEDGRLRWLVFAGALLGFAFLTKLLQACVIVPGLVAAYVLATPISWRQKCRNLAAAVTAFVCAATWWIAVVAIVPAGARPYVGSSQHNSVLEVVLGYNGLGRLTGHEEGISGSTGSTVTGGDRLFRYDMANQISWFLPAALILLAMMLWSVRGVRRGDIRWVPVALWGGWLLVTATELSYARGTVHPYYTIAMAPAIAALVGIGAEQLWARRHERVARASTCGIGLITVVWADVPFAAAKGWNSWMRPTAVAIAILGCALLWAGRHGRLRGECAGAALLVAACLFLPSAWSVKTAMTPHEGVNPLAGPPIGTVVLPFPAVTHDVEARSTVAEPRSHMGGILEISRPSPVMAATLAANAERYTWVAATVGANNAAGLELATRRPVMALGGFNATDPAPSLAQFQRLVSDGAIHYFVEDNISVGKGVSDIASRQIPLWVASHFTVVQFDSVSVYDFTEPLQPTK